MADGWRLVVGSDRAGYAYKNAILADLLGDPLVATVEDIGVHEAHLDSSTYPSIAVTAATKIAAGDVDRAILVCGTGIGVAIAANKVKGIRATVAHDSYSVERSIKSNDCQILTIGERVIGLQLARRLVQEWLTYVFDPGSHSQANVAAIQDYEGLPGTFVPQRAAATDRSEPETETD